MLSPRLKSGGTPVEPGVVATDYVSTSSSVA